MGNILKQLWLGTNKKEIKPKFYFNGCPVYKDYYLISEGFTWEEFCEEVDNYSYNLEILSNPSLLSRYRERSSEIDLDVYDSNLGIAAVENLKHEVKEFEAFLSDGMIGILP